MTTPSLGFTLTNPALEQATIEVGVSASLDVVLTNDTGGDIGLTTSPASTLKIVPPSKFFTADDIAKMTTQLDGWAPGVADSTSLVMTCTADSTWTAGSDLKFTIGAVESSAQPDASQLQIWPSQMTGNIPLIIQTALDLESAPQPGNASLTDTLAINLDSQGIVYRSEETDPLQNTLFLNIKNTGSTALYTGSKPRASQPKVIVSFVYGSTAGALAPDTNTGGTTPKGSAWDITASPSVIESDWFPTNPNPAGSDPHPQWVLAPTTTNDEVLGTGANANVTFEFSDIISFTPVGHTQMYALFTGFTKDDNTVYDDHVFVLDIVKQDAPPTRGLLAFHGVDPVLKIDAPGETVDIDLRWTMFDVASVQLVTSAPAVPPAELSYPDPKPLAYDKTTVTVPPIHDSQAIFATLQSFDGNGGFLNSMQFTVFAEVLYVLDPAGRSYTVALFGDTFWMKENYAFGNADSWIYNDIPSNEATYGRLYDSAGAAASVPNGWALPSADDWQALIDLHPSDPYSGLTAPGDPSFDAILGGERSPSGGYGQLLQRGVYWDSSGTTTQFVPPEAPEGGLGHTLGPGGRRHGRISPLHPPWLT